MQRVLIVAFGLVSLSTILLTACPSGTSGDGDGDGDGDGNRVADVLALTGDATNGADLYDTDCRVCHAPDGSGTASGANLQGLTESDEDLLGTIIDGEGNMPEWGGMYSDQELADVLAHIKTL